MGFFSSLIDYRSDRILEAIGFFLSSGEKVLSVGDGPGWVSSRMQAKYGVKVQGLDVTRWPSMLAVNDVPLDIYDGNNMPYGDGSYDTVAAVFVLHHCFDPERVLQEMIRVTREKIIIVEDIYETRLEKAVVSTFDFIENKSFSLRAAVPCNFKTPDQWERLFAMNGLELVKSAELEFFKLYPIRHHAYCLVKKRT